MAGSSGEAVASVAASPRRSLSFSPDDSETRFWLSTVAVGGWVTLLMVVSGMAYAVGFASGPHRLEIAVMVAVTGAFGALALWVIPWQRVIRRGWMEATLFCWSIL